MRALILAVICLFAAPVQAITVDIPGAGQDMSGIYVISAWDCLPGSYTVQFDGGSSIDLSYGSERLDTPCASPNNGIISIFNYNVLGAGPHVADFFRDGVKIATVNFQVVPVNGEFLPGVSGEGMVTLSNGQQLSLEWRQGQQGAAVIAATPLNTSVARLKLLLGQWQFTSSFFDDEVYSFSSPVTGPMSGGIAQLIGLNLTVGGWASVNRIVDLPGTTSDYEFVFILLSPFDGLCIQYSFDRIDATTVEGQLDLRLLTDSLPLDCASGPVEQTTFTGTYTGPAPQ